MVTEGNPDRTYTTHQHTPSQVWLDGWRRGGSHRDAMIGDGWVERGGGGGWNRAIKIHFILSFG